MAKFGGSLELAVMQACGAHLCSPTRLDASCLPCLLLSCTLQVPFRLVERDARRNPQTGATSLPHPSLQATPRVNEGGHIWAPLFAGPGVALLGLGLGPRMGLVLDAGRAKGG